MHVSEEGISVSYIYSINKREVGSGDVIVNVTSEEGEVVDAQMCDQDHVECDSLQRLVLHMPGEGMYTVNWYCEHYSLARYEICVKVNPDKILVFSCDMPEADGEYSLWTSAYQSLQQGQCILRLHLGDQIYADDVFHQCMRGLENGEDEANCYTRYLDHYRAVWSRDSLSRLMMVTPGLMTADDHEITNDLRLYHDMPAMQRCVATHAWKAYLDYQLSNRIEFCRFYSDESYIVTMGTTLILMIERTTRELNTAELAYSMSTLDLSDVDTIVVGLPCAPVTRPSGTFSRFLSEERYLTEGDAIYLYNQCMHWSEQGKRVILCGGDCHYATHRTIHRSLYSFDVLTASPITNQPTPARLWAQRLTSSRELTQDFSENIIDKTKKRAYAEICLTQHASISLIKGCKHPASWSSYLSKLWRMKG